MRRVIALLLLSPVAVRLAAAEPKAPPPAAAPAAPKYRFRTQMDTGPKIEAERRALERLAASRQRQGVQWDEWLRHYQKLLDEHPDGLLAGGEARWVGLSRTLHERLGSLPAAVRERYRLLFDGAASAALGAAVEREDPAAVTRVYNRYRFTTAGPRALAWLAERALDGGDAERAWRAFSRLAADAPDFEPQLATWLAKAITAGELAGRPAEVAALSTRLSTRLPDRPLKIRGRTLTAREWLRDRGEGPGGGESTTPAPSPSSTWPNFAGAADGGRGMVGSVGPRVRLAWQDVVAGAGMGLPDTYDGGRPRWGLPYRYPGVARFSHLAFPTVSDGRIYVQAPGSIRCVSLEDGKVAWRARETDLAPQRRYPTPGGFRWWRPQRATQTLTAVAGRLLLARVPAGRYENDSSGWPAEFVLAALDTRTGALLWQRSAGDGPPDSFYNLPTAAGQTLYSGISTSLAGWTEYRAAALDAATGDRLWTTYLGAGSDPMAGVDGSPAAVRDGIVWVESCLHTLCALDALTGEALWVVATRPDTEAPERSGWQDTMNVTNEPVSLIAPVGERVLFCPRWGREAMALNARTGHRAWSVDSSLGRVLIGVDDQRAVLAGEQIRSLDPATGRLQWNWAPSDRTRFGYPALVGSRIAVPGGSTTIFLDAATGVEQGRVSLRDFGAQPGAATLLVLGRRLLFSQPDRLIAVDETPGESLASLLVARWFLRRT
jgi:outer membrane protein assembly factor BamB